MSELWFRCWDRKEEMTNLHSTVINPFADQWLAACSCGWVGEIRPLRGTAIRDSDSHLNRELGWRRDGSK